MKVKVIGSGSMWNEYNSASYLIDKKTMTDYYDKLIKDGPAIEFDEKGNISNFDDI